ncbi:MAG TPA: LysR family transcriptional regulator [Candidatus Acidoferrales bacterium]|jgi:DNA-binding transcriptional LysR family regulator|nr:LysR family transcriptional regulator [Candidatus Acidoferrales bacterium]
MNVHHLELFYYVARHGGIMPAVRNIPYGIQQPAVSSQMAQLEEFLGATLFQRRPFALTEEGEKLYRFIHPFFANIDKIAVELQGGQARHIRIGASGIVLRDHLPEVFHAARKRFPGLKLSLREGYPVQLEQMLQNDEIDLAFTLIEKKTPSGVQSLTLLELPLVLLVEKSSALKSVQELWRRDKIDESLICLPGDESLCKNFQKKLADLGVDWFPAIEASSVDLIEAYVASGLGIGVSIAIPGRSPSSKVRALPLDGFPPLIIGAMWRGRKTPLIDIFLTEAQKRARLLV